MKAPSYEQLSARLGFPVPRSYARFVEMTIADAGEDDWEPFSFLPFRDLKNSGSEAISISKPGDSVIFGWTGCDSEHFVFVIDDDGKDDRERPIALWPLDVQDQTGLLANSFPEFLEWLAAIDSTTKTPDERMEFLTLIRTEFDVRTPRSEMAIVKSARKRRMSDKNVYATQDNVGVLLPPNVVDSRFLRNTTWPFAGHYSRKLQPKRLDEAERRLKLGEVGTALILARDYRYHFWYHDWKTTWEIIRRTSGVLVQAYEAMGRPMAAREIERQTEWNLMNVT